MCNYPAARRGDESSSAALFPAFPNDPAQHLLSEYSTQMMRLESPLADCFPRHQSVVFSPRLMHCLLRCSSPPSPLPDPIKASRQSRLGGRGDTLETLWRRFGTPGKAGTGYRSHQPAAPRSRVGDSAEPLQPRLRSPESRPADIWAGRARRAGHAKSGTQARFHCSPVF